MFHNDLTSEAVFYGKKLDIIGHLYVRPPKMKAAFPDVLFFCLYSTRILVDKKLLLPTAKEIQSQLSKGAAWEKVVSWAEDREFTLPARVIDYKGLARSAISASMMLGNTLQFRFSYIGFGLFSNGRHFNRCASASVYGMLQTIYRKNQEDRQCLDYLWEACMAVGRLELGRELRKGNCVRVAQRIYSEITSDNFPGLCVSP